MKRYGLIGYPLKNTFSLSYFTGKFRAMGLPDHIFENFPLEKIEDFPDLIRKHHDLCGLTITIPHKTAVIPFLDEVDTVAFDAGAVNCVKISRKAGSMVLTGYNTDVYGFRTSLLPFIRNFEGKALILGTGGASLAVAYVLKELKIPFTAVSRKLDHPDAISYGDLDETTIRQHKLIINCTPVGMFPGIAEAPLLPYHFITPQHIAFDLIYLPEETLFLKRCREQGAVTKNGLEMLHLQADRAWQIFQGEE